MIQAIAKVRGLSKALVACSYGAAVLTLTWLTQDGHLGDAMFGVLAMMLMAFPLSLAGGSLYGTLQQLIYPTKHDDPTYGVNYPYAWDYVLMAWPGIVLAIVLAVLLAWRRTRTAGRVIGWFLAAAVIVTGVVTIFDDWGPRRPYGWPFLVYGLIMATGLIAVGRTAVEEAAAADV
ncbi:hypothetical protein GCM10010149_78960 [Nonomuraea roseoviolacea subsp. roseoviolacea]|uniref:Uncharacterized protein n=1 Tax=Nonomuraea roseoviolacea subsp. carminata TaxID=160689 RepID=A0ABT1K8U5_9ACTN|nr:hypothetical protein [Nonomuraea roseoviolacea]MCP2350429.1 hypothetical protein [Nonomuraea roseoviolacea subsp. carminata]